MQFSTLLLSASLLISSVVGAPMASFGGASEAEMMLKRQYEATQWDKIMLGRDTMVELEKRIVYNPHITSPTSNTVWTAGETVQPQSGMDCHWKRERENLDGTVVDLGLVALGFLEFAHGLHKVLLHAVVAVVADGKHAGLGGDVAQVGAVESVAELDDGLVVELLLLGHRLGVDLEDLEARLLVGQRDLDLAVDTSRPHERRVERVGPVGGHDDLGLAEVVESVHLVEQLHERALDLAIRREQDTLGRLDAHAHKELRIEQGQLDHLAQLADLVRQSADAGKARRARILHAHVLESEAQLLEPLGELLVLLERLLVRLERLVLGRIRGEHGLGRRLRRCGWCWVGHGCVCVCVCVGYGVCGGGGGPREPAASESKENQSGAAGAGDARRWMEPLGLFASLD
ncbi:hypothetical protein L1887_57807 [Cichorium endivia]|nr:hypothetical protein L1887_57807 [Cichorium endivia]